MRFRISARDVNAAWFQTILDNRFESYTLRNILRRIGGKDVVETVAIVTTDNRAMAQEAAHNISVVSDDAPVSIEEIEDAPAPAAGPLQFYGVKHLGTGWWISGVLPDGTFQFQGPDDRTAQIFPTKDVAFEALRRRNRRGCWTPGAFAVLPLSDAAVMAGMYD